MRKKQSILSLGGNYDDLPPTPILFAKLGSTAPTLTSFIGNIEQYTFDATNDYVIGATEVTHSYKEGSDIEVHLHWATNGTNTNNRYVKWQLEYSIKNGSIDFSTAYTTAITINNEVIIPANTPSKTSHIINLGTISGTGIKIGAYIVWRLNRISASGTAPTNDPFALAVGFHVEQNSIGSKSVYLK